MRRERGRWLIRNTLVSGSSPHARGTREEDYRELMNSRFIPACAGNASTSLHRRVSAAVHPRMRGERMRQILIEAARRGSSPHARGTRTLDAVVTLFKRFIPACAGNASVRRKAWGDDAVHPRMRGERTGDDGGVDDVAGSSPHARGTLGSEWTDMVQSRFIPACAGNANEKAGTPGRSAVHPRMRGERQHQHRGGAPDHGSSPHARGTLLTLFRQGVGRRFIPACAGNASRPRPYRRRRAVHPRMRGERNHSTVCTTSCGGSSPHARGTLWIIACSAAIRPVHPRMRGERRLAQRERQHRAGSSPHARGTRHLPAVAAHRPRFIPACAGNAHRNPARSG